MKNKKILILTLLIFSLFLMINSHDVLAEEKESENIEKINEVVDFANIILTIDDNETSVIGEKEIIYDKEKKKLKEVNTKDIVKGKEKTISKKDYDSLLRIVEAEATSEGLKGKIFVANVIFNRFNTGKYEDIKSVIFEKKQFSPIRDGRYYSVEVTDETKEAVQEVLDGVDYSKGALYFMNKKTASKKNKKWFDNNLEYLFTYKNHSFYK